MSHEIRQHDKQQGREQAWHRLTDVKPDLSLENCWLRSWDIKPTAIILPAGEGIEGAQPVKTGFSILQSTDNPEIVIGQPYAPDTFKPISNAQLLEMVTESLKGLDLPLESCGSVMDRSRVFISVGLNETFRGAGREHKAFLNLGNGHDKLCHLWGNTSNTMTVCFNTFTINMLEAGKTMGLKVKHTKNSPMKLGSGVSYLKAALEGQRFYMTELDKLGLTPIDENKARALFAFFVQGDMEPMSTRAKNTVDRLVQLFKGGAGNNGENLADCFSAITDFYTHESRGGESQWKQFVSSEFGSAKNEKQRAWDLLTKGKAPGMISMGYKTLKATAEENRRDEETEAVESASLA